MHSTRKSKHKSQCLKSWVKTSDRSGQNFGVKRARENCQNWSQDGWSKWSKFEVKRLRKVVKSWVKVGGQKLLKFGSKTAPGGTSGQVPVNFWKKIRCIQGLLRGNRSIPEVGRKLGGSTAGPEVPVILAGSSGLGVFFPAIWGE
jgi:hypothetical protein